MQIALIFIHGIRYLQHPALWVAGKAYSYQELAERAAKLAGWLVQHKVRRVGIATTRTLSSYLGILAASWANVTYVPLNVKLPEHRLLKILQVAELDAIIIDPVSIPLLSPALLQAAPELIISPCELLVNKTPQIFDITALDAVPALTTPLPMQPEDIVYLMFTSGTTGEPKGVAVNLSNITHYVQVMQQRYPLTPQDRVGQFTQLSFDMSVFDIWIAWTSRATLYVVPEAQLLAPAKFIRQHELTVWYSVPSIIGFMHTLHLLPANAFPSLRYSLFAGEALKIEYAELWQQAAPNSIIDNLYGPTELTVTCLAQRFGEAGGITVERQTVAIGRPNPGMLAAIIDEEQQFLPIGATGELIVSGPQMVTGYWQQPELTASKFITLQHSTLGNTRWYKTGDYCYQDSQGCFHYLGRIDNQCKIQGYRVELEEIEKYLRQVSATTEVAVLAIIPPNSIGQILVGVIGSVNNPIDVKILKKQLQQELPAYMLPERFFYFQQLPHTIHGKLDRKTLQEWVMQEFA